jgi:hypothetical protein
MKRKYLQITLLIAYFLINVKILNAQSFSINPTFCKNDPAQTLTMNAAGQYNASSGFAGIAIILVTDNRGDQTSYQIFDRNSNLMLSAAAGSLSNNTTYVLFDNPCFSTSTLAGIPLTATITDAGSGIDNTQSRAGLYTYYYAPDVIEVGSQQGSGAVTYKAVGTASFPTTYTALTIKRTSNQLVGSGTSNITWPAPTAYQYVKAGTWSGSTGVSSSGTTNKVWFSGIADITRTVAFNTGNGLFTPSAAPLGLNTVTYTFNPVIGANNIIPSCNLPVVVDRTTTVYDYPTPAISGAGSGCTTFPATLNAGSGYTTYLWSTGATTSSINAASAGTYSVTVSNAGGCTGKTSATLSACLDYTVTDVCENAAPYNITPNFTSSLSSGKAGLALILVTDNWGSEITYTITDRNGAQMGSGGPLANNTTYVLYNNPCFNVTDMAGIPLSLDFYDTSSDGIANSSSSSGLYVYYYAADAMECLSDNATPVFKAPGAALFPSEYTAATTKRTTNPLIDSGHDIINLPAPSAYEYVSEGTWTTSAYMTNTSTISKTWFSGIAGLTRTLSLKNGTGTFTPSAATVGANNPVTYTYNSVKGYSFNPSCNNQQQLTKNVYIYDKPSVSSSTLCVTGGGANNDGSFTVNPLAIVGTKGESWEYSLNGGAFGTTNTLGSLSPNTYSYSVRNSMLTSCATPSSAIVSACPLPVECIAFSASIKNKTIVLNWKTASENNNAYFIIERSNDGVKFNEVSRINGSGNSTSALDYTYNDIKPINGTNYYRLKQVDTDGTIHFTCEIIKIEYNNGIKIDIFNTNSGPLVTGNIFSNIEEKVVFNVVNSVGQMIYQTEQNLSSGKNTFEINTANWSKGVYAISLYNSTGLLISERFILK